MWSHVKMISREGLCECKCILEEYLVCEHRRPDSFEGTFQIDETGTWTDDPVQASGRVDAEPSRRFEYTQPFAIRCGCGSAGSTLGFSEKI